jgi:hypothetical protein
MPELILDHEPWRVVIPMFGRRAKIEDKAAFTEALAENGLNLPLESQESRDAAAIRNVISTCQLILGDYHAAVDAPRDAYHSPATVRANLERLRAQCETLEAALRPQWRGGPPAAIGPFEGRWIEAAGVNLPDLRELYYQVRWTRENLTVVLRGPLKIARATRRNLPLDLVITGLLRVFRLQYRRPPTQRISTLKMKPPDKAAARMTFVMGMLKAAAIRYPRGQAAMERRVATINARLSADGRPIREG